MEMRDIKLRHWLHSMGIYDYDICDGVVHVVGNADLSDFGLTSIPVQFGYVSGYFDCGGNNLVSLAGCPSEVGGGFSCSGNQLTSLEGCPKEVRGIFYCSYNNLTSLIGCPSDVGEHFDCSSNMFKSKPNNSGIKIGGEFVWK